MTADAVCFMLDRIFDNWCNEAGHLLGEASAAEIDSVAAEFVHAGPFFVLNLANGNPIIVETNTLQAEEEGEHYRPAPVFRSVERWKTVAPGREIDVPEPQRSRDPRPPARHPALAASIFSTAASATPPTSTSAAASRLASVAVRSS